MTLGKLTGMERQKILDRLAALYALIKDLRDILSDESRITALIKEDLEDVSARYGDDRRTNIEEVENEILIEDLIEKQNCVITVTNDGYIKRVPAGTYSAQKRGGRGVTAMGTKEEDFVKNVFVVFSHDSLLLISNKGRMYQKKGYEIPEAGRAAKGTNLVNLLQLQEGEDISAGIPVKEFRDDEYLVFLTRNGVVKRVNLIRYQNRRSKGLFAIQLDEDDELLTVLKTTGRDHIFCVTRNGMAIRFDENDAREMGRTARGVRAVSMRNGDCLVGACAIPEGRDFDDRKMIIITENGFGKRLETSEFSAQRRGGLGKRAYRISEKTGKLAGAALVEETDDLMVITDGGMFVRTPVESISTQSRNASGVIVMRRKEGEKIVGFDLVAREPEDGEETGNPEDVPAPDAQDLPFGE